MGYILNTSPECYRYVQLIIRHLPYHGGEIVYSSQDGNDPEASEGMICTATVLVNAVNVADNLVA
jgi:hypothetical protein